MLVFFLFLNIHIWYYLVQLNWSNSIRTKKNIQQWNFPDKELSVTDITEQ